MIRSFKTYHVDVHVRPQFFVALTEDQIEHDEPEDVFSAGIFDHYEKARAVAKAEAAHGYCAKVVVYEIDTSNNSMYDVFDQIGSYADF